MTVRDFHMDIKSGDLTTQTHRTDTGHIDDLKKIINTNSAEFRKVLGDKFDHLAVWIEEIEKTRNILAHNNPVTKKDQDRLNLYAHDWSKLAVLVFEKLNN